MAVKLRLARFGKRGQAHFRLIAIDEHKKRDGKAIEILGSYNPHDKNNHLILNQARVDYWLSVGAKPSVTVKNLINKLIKQA